MANALEAALAAIPEEQLADAARGSRGPSPVSIVPTQPAPELPPVEPPAPVAAAPEPPPAAAPDPQTTEPEPDDDGSDWVFDQVAEKAPSLAGKYKNSDEFFKGIENLSRAVGTKGQFEDIGKLAVSDPEAALGIILNYLPEDKRAQVLGQVAPPTEPAAPATQPATQPATTSAADNDEVLAEYDFLMKKRPAFSQAWITEDKDGNPVAAPGRESDVNKYLRWKQQFTMLQEEHPDLNVRVAKREILSSLPAPQAPAPKPEESARLQQLEQKQQQVDQAIQASQFNNMLAAIVTQNHVGLPESERWMFPADMPLNNENLGNREKLTPAGKMFWDDLNRRITHAAQGGYIQHLNINDVVTDSLNRAKATLRQQAASQRPPAPKAQARQQATRPGEVAASVHSPAQGVREFPKGKSLEEALRDAAKQMPKDWRQSVGLEPKN